MRVLCEKFQENSGDQASKRRSEGNYLAYDTLHRGRLASHFQDVQLLLSHSLYHLIGTAACKKARDRAGRAWSRLDPPSRALTQISASLHLLEEDTHNAWQGAKCKRSPKTPTMCVGYTSCD